MRPFSPPSPLSSHARPPLAHLEALLLRLTQDIPRAGAKPCAILRRTTGACKHQERPSVRKVASPSCTDFPWRRFCVAWALMLPAVQAVVQGSRGHPPADLAGVAPRRGAGDKLAEHSGASKGKLLAALDKKLQEWDNPIAGASKFKQQVGLPLPFSPLDPKVHRVCAPKSSSHRLHCGPSTTFFS